MSRQGHGRLRSKLGDSLSRMFSLEYAQPGDILGGTHCLLDHHVPYEMQTIEKGKLKVPLKNIQLVRYIFFVDIL